MNLRQAIVAQIRARGPARRVQLPEFDPSDPGREYDHDPVSGVTRDAKTGAALSSAIVRSFP